MKRSNNIIFLVLLSVIFITGMCVFIKNEEDISVSENRKLETFQHFTLNSFFDGSFQNNFEKAISDQFLLSEEIRVSYRQAIAGLPSFGLKDNICHNNYLRLESNDGRDRGTFNCEDYIMYMTEPLSHKKRQIVENNIKKYNHLNTLSDVYYYFVDDPSSFDFRSNKKVNDYYGWLNESMTGEKGLSRLEYDNFEQYKKYFYKTDHHWNYQGSYQGFLDIAKMLGINRTEEPKTLYTNHECFYGSYSRATGNYDYCEEFSFYDLNLPNHKVFINQKPDIYNHYDDYKKHNYEYEINTNYYAFVYGDDFAEIIFDFYQPKEDNLLIISNSYSNAINELIARNFNKTYVVDLRHYKEFFDKDFIPKNYIEENDVDKVLVLMSPTFIWDDWPNRGLEL